MKEVDEKDEWCAEAYMQTDYSGLKLRDYENSVKKFVLFNLMNLSGINIGGDKETNEQSE